jgi:hypothetical protein
MTWKKMNVEITSTGRAELSLSGYTTFVHVDPDGEGQQFTIEASDHKTGERRVVSKAGPFAFALAEAMGTLVRLATEDGQDVEGFPTDFVSSR